MVQAHFLRWPRPTGLDALFGSSLSLKLHSDRVSQVAKSLPISISTLVCPHPLSFLSSLSFFFRPLARKCDKVLTSHVFQDRTAVEEDEFRTEIQKYLKLFPAGEFAKKNAHYLLFVFKRKMSPP